jgi:hypothetical protein
MTLTLLIRSLYDSLLLRSNLAMPEHQRKKER